MFLKGQIKFYLVILNNSFSSCFLSFASLSLCVSVCLTGAGADLPPDLPDEGPSSRLENNMGKHVRVMYTPLNPTFIS